MKATDVKPSRLGAAKRAATSFLNAVTPSIAVGSIEFARPPVLLQSPTTDHPLTRDGDRAAQARWRRHGDRRGDRDGAQRDPAGAEDRRQAPARGRDPDLRRRRRTSVSIRSRSRAPPASGTSGSTPSRSAPPAGTDQIKHGSHYVTSAVPVDPTELRADRRDLRWPRLQGARRRRRADDLLTPGQAARAAARQPRARGRLRGRRAGAAVRRPGRLAVVVRAAHMTNANDQTEDR